MAALRGCVILTAGAMFLIGPMYALAAAPETAMGGNCPVCLIKMGKLIKGDPKFSSVYDGKTYVFPGIEQKKAFDANPAAYCPALRGNCAVCKVEGGALVPGKPEIHVVHEGRIYLFPTEHRKRMFERDPAKYVNADLALDGNCPVTLVTKNMLIPGRPEYVTVYDGLRYQFRTPLEQRLFNATPMAYVPVLGGKCTVCSVEMNKDVQGDPRFHEVYEGRLYLFATSRQMDMFRADPDKYANADLAMNGFCPVCKVEMGKDVKGKKEFSLCYNGMRYLFPTEKHKEMFLANPSKYIPAK